MENEQQRMKTFIAASFKQYYFLNYTPGNFSGQQYGQVSGEGENPGSEFSGGMSKKNSICNKK